MLKNFRHALIQGPFGASATFDDRMRVYEVFAKAYEMAEKESISGLARDLSPHSGSGDLSQVDSPVIQPHYIS
jgi:hypothetical protein